MAAETETASTAAMVAMTFLTGISYCGCGQVYREGNKSDDHVLRGGGLAGNLVAEVVVIGEVEFIL